MKFVVSSEQLLERLQSISRVINSKNSLPILNYFLFSIKNSTLTLKASDLETTLITSMPLEKSTEDGEIAILAKNILDILREFSEQPLNFDVDLQSYAIVITTEKGKFSFIGQSAEEYPTLHELSEETASFSAKGSTLLDGISGTLFATADDELRPVMNGVCFDITTDNLTIVGTDAHKLARFKTSEVKGQQDAVFVLPKKPASLLKNILPKEAGEVQVAFDSKNIVFTLSQYTMVCRQIEARYPNYNAVIPKDNPNKLIVDRLALLAGLRRVAVCTNQGSSLIKFAVSESDVYISGQDIDFSNSGEEHIACQYQGEPMEIGFKANFVIEVLSNMNASDITIELADRTRPGVFVPLEKEENQDVLMLLMPMMLNE